MLENVVKVEVLDLLKRMDLDLDFYDIEYIVNKITEDMWNTFDNNIEQYIDEVTDGGIE